jgi:transcription initiation factor IIF auxiliary subunit
MRKSNTLTHIVFSPDKEPVEELPIRNWTIEVYLVGEKGQDLPATVFDKVTYELHPSFGKRARQGTYFVPSIAFVTEILTS